MFHVFEQSVGVAIGTDCYFCHQQRGVPGERLRRDGGTARYSGRFVRSLADCSNDSLHERRKRTDFSRASGRGRD